MAGFEPALRLVDHIDAALTAHDAAIAVALLERAEGVAYLHWSVPSCRGARPAALVSVVPWIVLILRAVYGGRNWD